MHGQRVDTDAIEVVPVAVERDELVGPQLAEDGDLLFDAPATVGEVLIQRLVLHPVATDADAQPQSSGGQQIQLGGLLGQQHGLALCADDDRRGQFEAW